MESLSPEQGQHDRQAHEVSVLWRLHALSPERPEACAQVSEQGTPRPIEERHQ